MRLDRPLLNETLHLAAPVVVGMLSSTIMGLIDLAMVGRLGAAELAAVGLATTILYAVVRTCITLGQGVQAIVARRVGEGKRRAVGHVLRVGQSLGLIVGLPLFAVIPLFAPQIMDVFAGSSEVSRLGSQYMTARSPEILFLLFLFLHRGFFEGIGRTGVPLVAGLFMLVANVFLNWCLIFGNLGFPALGVTGAGLASAAASFGGMALLALMTRPAALREEYDLRLGFSLEPTVLSRLWAITWPNAVRVFLTLMAFSIFLAIVERIGTLELAASNGVVRITSFSFMPAIGIGTGAGVLVGQALGRGDVARARSIGWHAVLLSATFMGAMGVGFLLIPGVFLRLFTDDPAILAVGIPLQRMMGIVQLFDAVGLTLAMAIMGAGHTRYVMLGDVGSAYLVFLPLAVVFGLLMSLGVLGAWMALVIWFVVFAGLMVWQWQWGSWWKAEV